MKRWLAVGVLGLALAGCAAGMPGSVTRKVYDLCVVEGGTPAYCEAWAPVEAEKITAGRVHTGVLVTVPVGR